jgi:hypothetical protein
LPITPFHFGAGALIKCVAPARVSWSVFAFANVLIDLEPVVLFFTTGDPAHPWLHTLPGALAVTAIAATAGRRPCEWFLRWWNSRLSPGQASWLSVPVAITPGAAWIGALTGTASHLLLDSIMHVDVRPLWPLSAANELQGLVTIEQLQWGCVIAGIVGVAVLAATRKR